jgi:hypothetical protein
MPYAGDQPESFSGPAVRGKGARLEMAHVPILAVGRPPATLMKASASAACGITRSTTAYVACPIGCRRARRPTRERGLGADLLARGQGLVDPPLLRRWGGGYVDPEEVLWWLHSGDAQIPQTRSMFRSAHPELGCQREIEQVRMPDRAQHRAEGRRRRARARSDFKQGRGAQFSRDSSCHSSRGNGRDRSASDPTRTHPATGGTAR